MKTTIPNILFLILIVLIFIVLIAIMIISASEKEENNVGGLKDITGAMQSFEVYHGTVNPDYMHIKTPKRYDDKYFEYLEHIKERRCKTFLR